MDDEWKGYRPFGGLAEYWRAGVLAAVRHAVWLALQFWYVLLLLALAALVLSQLFGLLEAWERMGQLRDQFA